jgi:hypothetical protein
VVRRSASGLLTDVRELILATRETVAEVFPDLEIVHALSAQLSWTHLRRIIYLDDPAGFLRGDVPAGAMEHADAASENPVDAVRAYVALKKPDSPI